MLWHDITYDNHTSEIEPSMHFCTNIGASKIIKCPRGRCAWWQNVHMSHVANACTTTADHIPDTQASICRMRRCIRWTMWHLSVWYFLWGLMYSLHVYASQLNLNYSGVVDDSMMVLVEIPQESKAVSHCEEIIIVKWCGSRLHLWGLLDILLWFVFLPAWDDDQGCRNRPSLSLNLVYLHMSQEN